MTTKTIRAATNGAKLIEATLQAGSAIVDQQYTVMSPRSPGPVYQGPNLQDAEIAFEKAAQDVRPG